MSLHVSKNPSWNDQFKSTNQRDFKIQVVISVVFGLSAFLSFCVCDSFLLFNHPSDIDPGASTKMEQSILCTQKALRCSLPLAGTAEDDVWMDSGAVQNY